LEQFARRLGLEVDLFDSDPNSGGGDSADITKDEVYELLRERITRGDYALIIAAPPCSTFSISRFFKSISSPDGGHPPVRTRTEIMGCRFLPSKHRAELERANDVATRMCALLMLAHRAGTEFIVENPADRGDITKPELFINALHGPLWLMAAVCALSKHTSAKMVTFAMCAFGAPWQKATTLMYTAGLSAWLDVLRDRKCEHSSHDLRQPRRVVLPHVEVDLAPAAAQLLLKPRQPSAGASGAPPSARAPRAMPHGCRRVATGWAGPWPHPSPSRPGADQASP
jgi:hypothetical protein